MADLAEYPIVVLENDAPEQVGKVGLFDLYMPVGDTGIVFVAAVPGTLLRDGPVFTEIVRRASYLRAATTLVQMGLIGGASLTFTREALGVSYDDLAELHGVPVLTVFGWENGAAVPYLVWSGIAQVACRADGRAMPNHHALCPDWRPRLIRVFPNVPSRGVPQSGLIVQAPLYPQQQPNLPGAECYPPPCC